MSLIEEGSLEKEVPVPLEEVLLEEVLLEVLLEEGLSQE